MIEHKNEKLGWINGHWGIFKDLKVPINDRGLKFADGIFETILILNGIPQLPVSYTHLTLPTKA